MYMYLHRGEKPSAILFLSCHGAVTDPMVLFYHSGICLSIASGDFTVCLFGCAFLKVGGSASFRMGMCRPQTDEDEWLDENDDEDEV